MERSCQTKNLIDDRFDNLLGRFEERYLPQETYLVSAGLLLTWRDQTSMKIPFAWIRQYCPCAPCLSFPQQIDSMEFNTKSVDLVGNYAIRFEWQDGHKTLYSWERLRRDFEAAPLPEFLQGLRRKA